MKKVMLVILAIAGINLIAHLFHGIDPSTVVDENGKPLADVHVVAKYRGEGFYFHGSFAHCYRVEAIVTGADGKFDFPYFSGNFDPRTILKRWTVIRYFKAGYELTPRQAIDANPVRMRPFSGNAEQRFEPVYGDYIILHPHNGCPDQERKLYPVLLAIHTEAKDLAKTFNHRKNVISLEYLIDLPMMDEQTAKAFAFQKKTVLKNEMGATE